MRVDPPQYVTRCDCRLLSNQKRFKELNAVVTAGIASLDSDVAAAVDAGVAGYAQVSANYASGLLHCFGNSIAAIPGVLRTRSAGPAAGVLLPSRAGAGSSSSSSPDEAAAAVAASAPVDAVAAAPSRGMSDFLGGSTAASAADEPAAAGSGAAAAVVREDGDEGAAADDAAGVDGDGAAAPRSRAAAVPPPAASNPFDDA